MGANALESLRYGRGQLEAGEGQLFKIVIMPSFGPAVSWEVCQKLNEADQKSYFAVQRQWQSEADEQQFAERLAMLPIKRKYAPPLQPTIAERRIMLTNEWAQMRLKQFQGLTISPYAEAKHIGLDGTSYELSFDEGFVSALYHWWEEAPDIWRPLEEFARAVLDELDHL